MDLPGHVRNFSRWLVMVVWFNLDSEGIVIVVIYIYIIIYIYINIIYIYIYINTYIPRADVRPTFHWGFSCVVICSGNVSDCFRVCLGLV